MSKEQRTYILYDSRACCGDPDEASVLVCCESNREAKSYCDGSFGAAMACFSYAHDGNQLVDERFEWNWYEPPRKRR
jgi:hypothetical protein